jgi:thiol-disulfide isomerase/thioredoxin
MSALVVPSGARFEPVAEPYDRNLDAGRALDAAFERARRGRTRVLAKFGGAWCPDCRVLAGMMTIPVIASFLDTHFEVVAIHIGRYDANMDIPARFGLTGGLEGAPALVIADAAGGVLNGPRIYQWRTARDQTPQDLADYLTVFAG